MGVKNGTHKEAKGRSGDSSVDDLTVNVSGSEKRLSSAFACFVFVEIFFFLIQIMW